MCAFQPGKEDRLTATEVITLKPQGTALFLDPPSERLARSSKGAYRADRASYLKWCDERELSLGDPSTLEAYRDFLTARSLRPASINRKLSGIKAGLIGFLVSTYGKEKAELLKPIYKSVKPIKQSKNEKVIRSEKILTKQEVDALIAAADPRTALIIQFLFKTGCRISEALNVSLTDIKETNGEAVEIGIIGKGSKGRRVFISVEELSYIKRMFNGEKFLFETPDHQPLNRINITKKLGRLSKRVLGKKVSAHTFRHSFATTKIAETGKILGVSEYLGHFSTALTLDMYVHETLSLSELL